VSRGQRGDQPASGKRQSPGQDVARGIAVRVVLVAAANAGEDRLAIAVRRVGVAAGMALLRGEARVHEQDLGARRLALVLDPLA
jgi:hypothetical protein